MTRSVLATLLLACSRGAAPAPGGDAGSRADAAPRGPEQVVVGEVRVLARVWPAEGGAKGSPGR